MNLLERIDHRLDDNHFRLQPSDFEACAAALIGREYPGLVPVTGGTDHGLDAELVKPDGDVIGLIVTSSRTWDGAKRSLRGSLASARDHQRRVDQVLVANLAEINRTRRNALHAIAEEFGCDLVQVYDRPWFAEAFRNDPDWRRKVLHLEGGAFSLSRTTRGARPDEHQLPTVGRDELLERAESSESDLVLWGVPGAGKSHVAGRLSGALFLERDTPPDRLLDDLLTARPKVVVVDDVGGRIADLEHLLHARRAEALSFRVAVTCWPHEQGDVRDHLPDALSLEVDLLTMQEIGTLLRARGITRTAILAHLLGQAQGRPAWALNLADLLIRQGAWEDVWSGRAVRKQIRAFLRRSGAPDEALYLLAAIALSGEVNPKQAWAIARLFGFAPPKFDRAIREVAIAGLVDVRDHLMRGPADGQRSERYYRVVPRLIAAGLVADFFFTGHAMAVSAEDIKEALPELRSAIVRSQIDAALLGADGPTVPPQDEIIAALNDLGPTAAAEELLRSYARIDHGCSRFVLDHLLQSIQEAAERGDERFAVEATTTLTECVAESLRAGEDREADAFFTALTVLADHGWDCTAPIRTMVEDVRNARIGDPPTSTTLLHLCSAMVGESALPVPDDIWLTLAGRILQPTFEVNYMNPEQLNSMILQSFTWAGADMNAIYGAIDEEFARRIIHASNTGLAELVDALDPWVRIAVGYSLPFVDLPNSGQRAAAGRVATSMAAAIATQVTTPGLRALLNRTTASLDIVLEEPDALFAALTSERELFDDWREDRRRREETLDRVLKPYLDQPPSDLMSWLAVHAANLTMLNHAHAPMTIMARLAQRHDREAWLRAALEHGMAHTTSPLVGRCIDEGEMPAALAADLLADAGGRGPLITGVIGGNTNPDLTELVIGQLTLDDFRHRDLHYALVTAAESTRRALFTHSDDQVRSVAAAHWAAGMSYSDQTTPVDPDWATAMRDLVLPSDVLPQDVQSSALDVLAKREPEVYIDLFVSHVDTFDPSTGYHDFEAWQSSARELSSEHRIDLWNRVRASRMAPNLFWVIAAGDAEWISTAVSDSTFPVPLSTLLRATRFQMGLRYRLETLAVMLRPMKWKADDLLWTLEVGMHEGEEHERLERHLKVCRELAASPEPDLAALGRRGVEVFQPRWEEARAAARRAAVRGTLGL